jgi:hypothetical protein
VSPERFVSSDSLELGSRGEKGRGRTGSCASRTRGTLPNLLAAALQFRAQPRVQRARRTRSYAELFCLPHRTQIYVHVDRQKGRFRSFLLASLKNFLSHASDRERTLKRGSGQDFLPLHEEQIENAESLFQTHSVTCSEDRLFDRSWAAALVAAGLERLAADYKGESKEKLFKELRPFLGGGADPPPTYAELTVRLGIPESTLRSHVTRLRARYREALHAEVRRTVETESQAQEELHELLRVLTES